MTDSAPSRAKGSPAEVLWVALQLGVSSFGGPIAHLGYFEQTYVQERRWLDHAQYAALVALCQLLPGPTSSQVGFLIGYRRAGTLGSLAGWIGFTLPSALLMFAFALLASRLPGPAMQAAVHGLMLTALVIVAQAVWNMARSLCPDWQRRTIALLASALLLYRSSAALQIAAMVAGGLGGGLVRRRIRPTIPAALPALGIATGWVLLALFGGAFLAASALASRDPHGLAAFSYGCYRAGALVFGGGHVVLPLLRDALVPAGWLSDDAFLSGYGFAQALPGPLFTFAAYLGAVAAPPHQSALWAGVALVSLFLPGLLLALAASSLAGYLARAPLAPAVLAGINAAVVGILGAALYNPLWLTAIHSGADLALAATGLLLLQWWRAPPLLVAALCVTASSAISWLA